MDLITATTILQLRDSARVSSCLGCEYQMRAEVLNICEQYGILIE